MAKRHNKQSASKRKRQSKDPHAAREAQRYERPIPSREVILGLLEAANQPLSFKPLAHELGLAEETDLESLRRRLGAMIRDGQLLQNRRGGYCLASRVGVITGTVIGHREGFGFVSPDEGGDDIFLSPRQMRPLLNGDRVSVRIRGEDHRGRPEGSVVDVLERGTTELVGRYFIEHGAGIVSPDNSRFNQDVLIPATATNGATHGQIVIAEITDYPSKHSPPIGRIKRILGEHRAAGMEVEIAIHSHNLPHEWPKGVENEANAFGETVRENDKQGRTDLRHLPLVTIDGEDARDFDDAIYCEARGDKGWRLLVAIADVSHYVKRGTALDKEAQNRATSVYFPDWVIPMLPESLSNGLCSLNPQVDRLCMVCDMKLNTKGQVTHAHFYEGVMRSAARLTYTQVGALFTGEADTQRKLDKLPVKGLVAQLQTMHDLYRTMRRARGHRGALDFDRPETRIVFDANRKIERITPVVRNDAHKLIEECMIAANVAAAHFLSKHKMPALYRIHDGPQADRVTELRQFLGPLGLTLGGGDKPSPKDYEKVLSKVADRPDKYLIETVLLRSLSRAVYSPDNIGHFGLAHEQYLHFTSPIRRYPDLLVHRAIRHILRGGNPEKFHYTHKEMETLGQQTSMAEQRADEATREAVAWLKCDYMRDKVGEVFSGTITGVTGFGFFVELDDVFTEGLVHVSSLDNDYYRYESTGQRLVGERSGIEYRLTDRVTVKVASVNVDDRKIDFALVEKKGKKK